MISKITFLLLVIAPIYANAQYWIVGDTVGRNQIIKEQTFEPNAEILFDIDCDGEEDLRFDLTDSEDSYNGQFLVIRNNLFFYKVDNVEALHDFGLIQTFDLGDSLPYADSLWSSLIWYIYFEDRMGNYGHRSIENMTIAFRKNAPDTTYCFIKLSNFENTLTIHEVITVCENNPIEIVTGTISPLTNPVIIYPNPANNQLSIKGTGTDIDELVIYDNKGKETLHTSYAPRIDISGIPKGLSFVKVIYKNGKQSVHKLLVQ